jgi:hypothetical protein
MDTVPVCVPVTCPAASGPEPFRQPPTGLPRLGETAARAIAWVTADAVAGPGGPPSLRSDRVFVVIVFSLSGLVEPGRLLVVLLGGCWPVSGLECWWAMRVRLAGLECW